MTTADRDKLLIILCTMALDKKIADFIPGGDDTLSEVNRYLREGVSVEKSLLEAGVKI